MGYSGAKFDPEKVDLYFESAAGKLKIIENGVALDYSEEEATKVLSEKAVTAVADIKMGEASASAWGCDLTLRLCKDQCRLPLLSGKSCFVAEQFTGICPDAGSMDRNMEEKQWIQCRICFRKPVCSMKRYLIYGNSAARPSL